jgi:signal transduction histidine kinase
LASKQRFDSHIRAVLSIFEKRFLFPVLFSLEGLPKIVLKISINETPNAKGVSMSENPTYEQLEMRVQKLEKALARQEELSQLAKSEQKLRRDAAYRLKQSIQADRLAALGEVVAGVAHEINNPNSFITYNVPMLKEIWDVLEPVVRDHAAQHAAFQGKPIQPDEMIQDMNDVIESIRIGSERISKVVVNLKDFARLDESPEFKPIDINEVIEKTLTIVGAQLRRSADRVVTHLDEDLPEIQGHFGKVEQVLANLLTNASHALPQKRGSVISISTRYIKRLGAVVVAVEDNGNGIALERQQRIFEPFYTSRRSTGGTGLGLSISHGIVKEHKGILGVLSKPGLGTRFSLFLPENQDVTLDLEPTILCVDDEKAFPEIIRTYFAKAKPAPAEVMTDPKKVVDHLVEHPEIDVVISDIRMPHLNGWELLEQIKERFPLMSVILYSGHPEELEKERSYRAKPDGLIQKPFELKHLERRIEKIGRCLL